MVRLPARGPQSRAALLPSRHTSPLAQTPFGKSGQSHPLCSSSLSSVSVHSMTFPAAIHSESSCTCDGTHLGLTAQMLRELKPAQSCQGVAMGRTNRLDACRGFQGVSGSSCQLTPSRECQQSFLLPSVNMSSCSGSVSAPATMFVPASTQSSPFQTATSCRQRRPEQRCQDRGRRWWLRSRVGAAAVHAYVVGAAEKWRVGADQLPVLAGR